MIESIFRHRGLICVVRALDSGHRCGYVQVKPGSKFYCVNYMSSPTNVLNVHGGITFGEEMLQGVNLGATWWVGFDCAHCGDGRDESIMSETWKKAYHGMPSDGKVWTIRMVEDECRKLAEQIADEG